MFQEDQQMVGIHQCLLGRALEEIFGMMGEELVNRTRRGDHHSHCGFKTATRATRLLTRGSNGARVSDKDRRAQSADVDSELQRVCGNDGFYRAIAEALFDFAALVREVARAIATNW